MPDFTRRQKKIIDRYYDQRDTIMLTKLSELVTELYLAETDKKREQLWGRVEKAMTNLKVPAATATRILDQRKPEMLASHVKDWLASAQGK